MKTDETIVNLIFDAGKGSVSQSGREAVCGEPYGTLPTPVRRGYRFEGWYAGGTLVTADTVLESDEDVRLQARWARTQAQKKKASSFKRQKWAVVALACVTVVLLIAWAIVAQLISVYHLTDTYTVDGKEYSDRYTIKREDGVYKMFDSDGKLMPTRENVSNVYIAVKSGNQYLIDPETGEYSLVALVDPESLDDYEAAAGTMILLYPEISSSYLYDIEVTNEHGTYKFIHTPDGTYIEGFEDALFSYDRDLYARLVVGCGWTTASRKLTHASDVAKLEDGSIDYSVYGLDTPAATYTIRGVLFKKDSDGNDLYSGGKPVVDYKTETVDGESRQAYRVDPKKSYTVHIGDMTPSRDGFYVRIDGKNSIYILNAEYLGNTVMKPIESMVEPQAVYPVSVNTHSMANNFMLLKLSDNWNDKQFDIDDHERIVSLTYEPLELRQYTMDTSFPYRNFDEDLMDGYYINASHAMAILGRLFSLQYVRCVKLGLDADTLEEYGFNKNAMALQYGIDPDDSDGANTFLNNLLFISTEENENGNYYVASQVFDMIVEVEPYYLPFIRWDVSDWYEKYFLQVNLAYMKEMTFSFGDQAYSFSFNHDTAYCYYVATKNGVKTLEPVDLSDGHLERDGTKLYYITTGGDRHEVSARINFDTVERVSYREAILNPKKENIIYTAETYYYVNAQGQNVRVTPDFVNNDIVRRDGVLYFVGTVNGQKVDIAVHRQFGEPVYRYKEGLEVTVSVGGNRPQISCDQYSKNDGVLDYTIKKPYQSDVTGETLYEMISAEQNYSRLHLALISYVLEGDVKEKDLLDRYGMTVSQFIDATDPTATIRITSEDQAKFFNGYYYYDRELGEDVMVNTENKTWNVEINFYQYTDQKAILTVRTLDEDGDPIGSEYGRFYVSASYLETLHGYVEDLINERAIPD